MGGISKLGLTSAQLTRAANTIRLLSADGVEAANSGHPGMPMGMADIAAVVWLKYLTFAPNDPKWLARDRFVLSNGHGSMLLYSLLHLSGFDLSIDDLKQFRQFHSKTPGHPESFMTAGVECTTGPLGQGISNAVGMAIAQRVMAARYDKELFEHRTIVFAGDGCLMEGVASEASSIAGHLGLGNLIVFYDDNHISIAGDTKLAFTEDRMKRYEAYGWHTQEIDGHNCDEIASAFEKATAVADRPSIIAARTIIGKGSPHKAGNHDVHGSPLGKEELELTKKGLGFDPTKSFEVPSDVRALFASRSEELKACYQGWQEKFDAWKKANAEQAKALDAQLNYKSEGLAARLLGVLPEARPNSTRKLSQIVLQEASAAVSSLIGGSADLEPSTLTLISKSSDIQREEFGGLNIRFGVREHGMGAVMNGLSYYGGFIPYGSTFLCFYDYMRPTLRLAAISKLRGLFIFTHDSIFLGEDGPTHQPIEHLNTMRMVPNLWVMRPADGIETAMCYAAALERSDGPVAFSMTRQNLDPLVRPASFSPEDVRRGGYAVTDCAGDPDLVFVATGSEVALAVKAAESFKSKLKVRVVSMPCYELFASQPESYRKQLIPTSAKKVVVEAGSMFGWFQMVGGSEHDTVGIGMAGYGASAPASVLAEKFGFTPQAIEKRVREKFSL